MDGEELVKHLRASPRYNDIPVFVISSADNPAKEHELLEMGVRAVLKKPVTPASLVAVLGKLDEGWGL
jgi:CheY-like chemotaxis protein